MWYNVKTVGCDPVLPIFLLLGFRVTQAGFWPIQPFSTITSICSQRFLRQDRHCWMDRMWSGFVYLCAWSENAGTCLIGVPILNVELCIFAMIKFLFRTEDTFYVNTCILNYKVFYIYLQSWNFKTWRCKETVSVFKNPFQLQRGVKDSLLPNQLRLQNSFWTNLQPTNIQLARELEIAGRL